MTTRGYVNQRHAVLVTGGSDGIGLGLARRYLRRGDRVLVTGRRRDRLQAVATANPGLEIFAGDIGSPSAREELAARIGDVMPELDTIINNAGIQRRKSLAADDEPWTAARSEIEILLDGPIHLNRLLVPVLLRADRDALIVNVTSGGAYMPQTFAPIYSAAKAALHSYTMNLRWALAETRVAVTELIPPAVATGLAGEQDRHGADIDDFCDSVFPRLDGTHDDVGFGVTDSEAFRAMLATRRELFLASAGRSSVQRYPTAASPEANKDLVRRYYEHVSNGERAKADALIADDATWWIAGDPAQFPIAGCRPIGEHQAMLRRWVAPNLPNGVRTRITGMTAEGDRVAVEMENEAETAAGKHYSNRFHLLFEVRGGKIHAVREYLDTLHAEATLLDGRTSLAE